MNDKSQVKSEAYRPISIETLNDLQSQLTKLQSANESQAEVIGKFEDAVGPDLCVSEALDGIRKIKLQLTQAKADNTRLSESHIHMKANWTKAIQELVQAHKERDEAVEACAAWKQVCHFRPHPREYWDDTMKPDREAVYEAALQAAESTSAGKAFLERMKEAEWLVVRAKPKPEYHSIVNKAEYDEWVNRRDAFLKGGAK